MNTTMIIISLFGGMGLFLYGMDLMSKGLQKVAANRIKSIIEKLTKKPFLGVFLGIIIAFSLQGSGAASVLIVGLVSAELMTFSNALSVVMGAAIGTTLTVQLIAFNITDYALILVAIGATMAVFSPKRRFRQIGQVILGFGLIFYGMGVMSDAMVPLKESEAFVRLLVKLTDHPILSVLVASIFTAIIHSSAATLVLAMSLVTNGVIDSAASIPIMYGANIGTTTTALLLSLASSREAKRVAVANFIFKIIGVLLFLPFTKFFASFSTLTSSDVARQIANSHTIFNVVNTIVLLPFIPKFAEVLIKILPADEEEKIVTKFLDKSSLDVPDIALWQTKNELVRLAKRVNENMLSKIMNVIKTNDEETIKIIEAEEKKVDASYTEISIFLTGIVHGNITEKHSEMQIMYLNITNDLEHIGDVVYELVLLSQKIKKYNLRFFDGDLKELNAMQLKIRKNLNRVIDAITDDNLEIATEVLKNQPEIARIEKSLRYNHFMRVSEYSGEDMESSSVYLDLINKFLRINQHTVSMAQAALGIV